MSSNWWINKYLKHFRIHYQWYILSKFQKKYNVMEMSPSLVLSAKLVTKSTKWSKFLDIHRALTRTTPLRIKVFHSLLTFLFHPNFVGFKNYSSISRAVACFTLDEAHEGGIYENSYTHLNLDDKFNIL
jgi:hypothetical protein